MEDETKKILEGLLECPPEERKDLVRLFKLALKEAGVQIEEKPPAKYFAAGLKWCRSTCPSP